MHNKHLINFLRENKITYREYLKSGHWIDLKLRFFDHSVKSGLGVRCNVCGTNKWVQVHHKSYKRLGNERLSDLVVLCGKCHKDTHGILDKSSGKRSVNIWNAHKKLKRTKSGKSRRSQTKSVSQKQLGIHTRLHNGNSNTVIFRKKFPGQSE